MRVWVIVVATAAVAAIAILVWRPWGGDERAPAEVAVEAPPEPAPVAPPPSPPDPVTDAGAVAPPPAPPRPLTLGRVPDSAVVPVVPTAENREQLLALRKNFMGHVPAFARLYAEFARAGRPLPPATRQLIEMRRDGASNAAQVEFVRTSFTEQADREIILRWLANSPPPTGAAAPVPAGGR